MSFSDESIALNHNDGPSFDDDSHSHEHSHGHHHHRDHPGRTACWNVTFISAVLIRAYYILIEARSPLTPEELPIQFDWLNTTAGDESFNSTQLTAHLAPNDDMNPFNYPVPAWGVDSKSWEAYLLGGIFFAAVVAQSFGVRYNVKMHHHHLSELPKLLKEAKKRGELTPADYGRLALLALVGAIAMLTIYWDVVQTLFEYCQPLGLPIYAPWVMAVPVTAIMLFVDGYLFLDVILDWVHGHLDDHQEPHSHVPPFTLKRLLSGFDEVEFNTLKHNLPFHSAGVFQKIGALTGDDYNKKTFTPNEVRKLKLHMRGNDNLKSLVHKLQNKGKLAGYIILNFCGVGLFAVMYARMLNGGFNPFFAGMFALLPSPTALAEAGDLAKTEEDENEKQRCCPKNALLAILLYLVLGPYMLYGHIIMSFSEFLVFSNQSDLDDTPLLADDNGTAVELNASRMDLSLILGYAIAGALIMLNLLEVSYHLLNYVAICNRWSDNACPTMCRSMKASGRPSARSVSQSVTYKERRSRRARPRASSVSVYNQEQRDNSDSISSYVSVSDSSPRKKS